MGIKMGRARDAQCDLWEAATYNKGAGVPPLQCEYCSALVAHQNAHTRRLAEKSISISAYFRLRPEQTHSEDCTYNVPEQVKTIAAESEGLIESIKNGKYRLRLAMIKEAFDDARRKPEDKDKPNKDKNGKVYQSSGKKLPGYINTAQKVLQMRALCEEDEAVEEHLLLTFDGDTVTPWSRFYFEGEGHLAAADLVEQGYVTYPIAICGTVKTNRSVERKDGEKTRFVQVLTLNIEKYIPHPDDSTIGLNVAVSVWCDDASWLAGIETDDEVILFGFWRYVPGLTKPSTNPRKYKQFQTDQLRLYPILRTQIAKVER